MAGSKNKRKIGMQIAQPSLSVFKGAGMDKMQYLIFGTISLSFATLLAFYQSAMSAEFAIIKDLGMGGAFIVAAFFMFRYFTKEIEAARKESKELTEKFMQIAKQAIERETQTSSINQQVIGLLTKINEGAPNGRKYKESQV